MIAVSEIYTTPPATFRTELQEKVYATLSELAIPYQRVDCEEAITMEDCIAIDEALHVETVKTLFLANRQETQFYLLVTPGNKPFRTKDFSHTLGVSRVSFATPEKLLELWGCKVGAATIFGLLLDPACRIRTVIDRDVLSLEDYACTDSTTTGYMKVKTTDILEKFLPHVGHTPDIIIL